ncbi:hypothetical protein V7114_21060 [Neobacillus niacini]|uniref:hypothetical protein n=1 Tax=Neobacillus niacini TaxID=86668 RepID=UPI002FFF5D77
MTKSFINKEDAMIYLFDHGVRTFKYLTKALSEYKDYRKLPIYEFWHLDNRVGYILYDFEQYVDENDEIKKRKAYVWRFVGFGRSCFAPTRKELGAKVLNLILQYRADPEECGRNTYPFYTKYYRNTSEEIRTKDLH